MQTVKIQVSQQSKKLYCLSGILLHVVIFCYIHIYKYFVSDSEGPDQTALAENLLSVYAPKSSFPVVLLKCKFSLMKCTTNPYQCFLGFFLVLLLIILSLITCIIIYLHTVPISPPFVFTICKVFITITGEIITNINMSLGFLLNGTCLLQVSSCT